MSKNQLTNSDTEIYPKREEEIEDESRSTHLQKSETLSKHDLENELETLKREELIEIIHQQIRINVDLYKKTKLFHDKVNIDNDKLKIFFEKINEHMSVIERLKENWDENGAKKFEKSFLNYIYQIIENLSKKFLQKQNKVLDIPAILPLCDGSIDIHWKKNSEYDILINIPPLNEKYQYNEVSFACDIGKIFSTTSSCVSEELDNVIIPWLAIAMRD